MKRINLACPRENSGEKLRTRGKVFPSEGVREKAARQKLNFFFFFLFLANFPDIRLPAFPLA
jgi:hypothetical protein